MPSRSRRNSLLSHAAALLVGAVLALVAAPIWREGVIAANQQRYALLVEQCDSAMRDHYQAKMHAADEPSRESGLALESAELGLTICQDYDLYQKRLIQWGLRENELARMRLEAIEARAGDFDEMVATHEIRF